MPPRFSAWLLLLPATCLVACSAVGGPLVPGPVAFRFALPLLAEDLPPRLAPSPSPSPSPSPEGQPAAAPAPSTQASPGAAGGGGGGGGSPPLVPTLNVGVQVAPGGFSDPSLPERASSAP